MDFYAVSSIFIGSINQKRKTTRRSKMTVIRNRYTGAITISDIIDNHLVENTYFDYTLEECKHLFKDNYKNNEEI